MDPHTGRIYDEKEIEALPQDIKQRLVYGSLEELQAKAKAIEDFDVQKEAEELGEILDEMDRVISLDDPLPDERFFPTNRVARRRAERLERKQKPKFVNKPGKVRDNG